MTTNSSNHFTTWELNPKVVGTILGINKELCVKRIKQYFCPFESRTMKKDNYFKKYGKEQIGFTGSFFEEYSEKSNQNCFDGNDVSAAISLSITGSGFWVASLLNEKIDLSYFSKHDYNFCISDAEVDFFDKPRIKEIYKQLKSINGISHVTASKLLASKRPNLFPIFDTDVSSLFLRSDGTSWNRKVSYLDWCKSWQKVMADTDIRILLAEISKGTMNVCQPLRALDVIFWLECFDRKKVKNGYPRELLKLTL